MFETLHGSGCMEVTHSFLSGLQKTQPSMTGESPEKDHSGDLQHSFQFETDFDAHRCNRKIISILHFPHCSFSVCRDTYQEIRKMTFKAFISITTEQSSFHSPIKHTLLLHGGIFSQIIPLQQRGVRGCVFFLCYVFSQRILSITIQWIEEHRGTLV